MSFRAHRRLVASTGVSALGSQVTVVAAPLTAVLVLHAGAAQAALLSAAATAPFLLLALPAGAWVDRWDRRRTMLVTDVLRGLLLLLVPAAAWLGVLDLALLAVVAFLVGALGVLFDVAALSAAPSLAEGAGLARLNGQLEVARAAAHTGGPAAAGLLVQVVTAPFALLVDAASYLASALLLRGLPSVPSPGSAATDGSTLAAVAAGLRYCWKHPYVRPLAMTAAWSNLWAEGVMAVLVPYAVRDLGLSAGQVGLVLALANVGYLIGGALAPTVMARVGVGRTALLGAALSSGLVLVPLDVAGPVMLRLATGLGLAAAGGAIWNVAAVSLRQATTPEAMLSRMNATNRFVIWGTMPLGSVVGGALAALGGPALAVVVCAILAPLCLLPVFFSAVRPLRDLPTPQASVGTTGPRPPDRPAVPALTVPCRDVPADR